MVQLDLDAVRPARFGCLEGTFVSSFQMEQHGFDVFAGPQAVDAEIDAIAGEMAAAQVAHLDRVSQSAARLDTKIREDRMRRRHIGDDEGFLKSSGPTLVDLVGVSRAPVVSRRHNWLGSSLAGMSRHLHNLTGSLSVIFLQ